MFALANKFRLKQRFRISRNVQKGTARLYTGKNIFGYYSDFRENQGT
jgi:hypothetical protein